MTNITLNLTKEQAHVIAEALEMYQMVGIGHLDEILEQQTLRNLIEKQGLLRNQKAREKVLDLKETLTGLHRDACVSIHNEDVVHKDTKLAFDLMKEVRLHINNA